MLGETLKSKILGKEKAWIPFGGRSGQASGAGEKTGAQGDARESFCAPSMEGACVTVCTSKAGCHCGSEAVREAFVDELARRNLPVEVGLGKVGCGGKCRNGPYVGFPAREFFYLGVKPENVAQIVEESLVKGYVLFPYLSIGPDRSYRNDIIYEKDTGLIATIHDKVCLVEVAKYFLDFESGLSCGKCVPCRIGMQRMMESMDRMVSGTGTTEDLDQVKSLCQAMLDAPMCEFAMTSSRPVLSAITHFEDEFRAHIERQECPAGVCAELVEIQRKRAIRERLKGKTKKK
jgi:(2Fe-2S) ferredoxin